MFNKFLKDQAFSKFTWLLDEGEGLDNVEYNTLQKRFENIKLIIKIIIKYKKNSPYGIDHEGSGWGESGYISASRINHTYNQQFLLIRGSLARKGNRLYSFSYKLSELVWFEIGGWSVILVLCQTKLLQDNQDWNSSTNKRRGATRRGSWC